CFCRISGRRAVYGTLAPGARSLPHPQPPLRRGEGAIGGRAFGAVRRGPGLSESPEGSAGAFTCGFTFAHQRLMDAENNPPEVEIEHHSKPPLRAGAGVGGEVSPAAAPAARNPWWR